MATITIYDNISHSHCGCGSNHHPEVTTFNFEVAAVRAAGATIEQHNFDEEPMAFMSTPINKFVAQKGVHRLPAVVVDGAVVLDGRYPTREELADWAELDEAALATLVQIPEDTLPLAGHGSGHGEGSCGCGGKGHGHSGEHEHAHGHGHGGGGCCGGGGHGHGGGSCGCGGHGHH